MYSIQVPSDIQVSVADSFLKREGPRGILLKQTGNTTFSLLSSPEGNRLFINKIADRKVNTYLSTLAVRREGLSRGIRCRLRLVGVGFRATTTTKTNNISNSILSLKLGYSHEVNVPLSPFQDQFQVTVKSSRLEGRSKGTLISLEGRDRANVYQVASRLRKFRLPDSYKGKGIRYDKEVLTLKKGKREN